MQLLTYQEALAGLANGSPVTRWTWDYLERLQRSDSGQLQRVTAAGVVDYTPSAEDTAADDWMLITVEPACLHDFEADEQPAAPTPLRFVSFVAALVALGVVVWWLRHSPHLPHLFTH